MYTEFIIIYALLAVVIVLLIVTLILVASLKGKVTDLENSASSGRSYGPAGGNGGTVSMGSVTCKNCGAQFDGIHKICPRCGTSRF